jgi:hypothetical protein
MAEMCLSHKNESLELVQELKDVANEEQMEFIDGSEQTARGLKIIGHDDHGRKDGSPTIHLVVQRDDGLLVTVGNMGLPGNQVAIGFSEGPSRAEATRFADRVIGRLRQHWTVDVLAPGSGVIPSLKCT